jgi:hypothetical protein
MSCTNEPRSNATGVSPRTLNVILGAWLFISAFAWPHTRWQFVSTSIPGVFVVVFALAACVVPRVRFLNTTLAAYLFVSAWFYSPARLPEMATQWHNAIVGLWIFLISVLHDGPVGPRSCASGGIRSRLSA